MLGNYILTLILDFLLRYDLNLLSVKVIIFRFYCVFVILMNLFNFFPVIVYTVFRILGFSSMAESKSVESFSGNKIPRRVCVDCGTRMSSFEYDQHLKCSSCTGQQCTLESRCDGCKEWPEEVMLKYVKHQQSLKQKRDSKKRQVSKSSKESGNSQQSGVTDSDSIILGSEEDEGSQNHPSLKVLAESWENRFSSLEHNIASSLEKSMLDLFSNMSKQFLSSSPHVPVTKPSGNRKVDPSPDAPKRTERSRGNPVEQVLGGLPQGPVNSVPSQSPVFNPVINKSNRDRISVGDSPGTSGEHSHNQEDNNNDNDDDEDDDDFDPLGPDDNSEEQPIIFDSASIQFRQMYDLVKCFFPQAVVTLPPVEETPAVTEGVYARQPEKVKEPCRFKLFHKFEKVKGEIASSYPKRAIKGKRKIGYLLKHDRGSYQLADSEDLEPAVANPSVSRLTVRPVTDKMAVTIPMEEMKKMESLLVAMQEGQSFSMWLMGAIINYAKSCGFVPPDIQMFERMCHSFTSSQVRSHAFMLKLQSYFELSRRKLFLSHTPPSLSDAQKNLLLSHPPFSKELFDENTLNQIINEHQSDVNTSSNQNLVQAITHVIQPMVKKRKFEQSAPSSGQAKSGSPLTDPGSSSSAAPAPSVSGRGSGNRGRGPGG